MRLATLLNLLWAVLIGTVAVACGFVLGDILFSTLPIEWFNVAP
jgi:hypothetical protein